MRYIAPELVLVGRASGLVLGGHSGGKDHHNSSGQPVTPSTTHTLLDD